MKSRKDGNIIYADLGTSLYNKPEIPPPPDRVIYSDTCEMTAIKVVYNNNSYKIATIVAIPL